MMYGMNAPREEMNGGGCRNRGRSVSMAGGNRKVTKSVTINEEESEEGQSTERAKKQPITGILKHK
jgi:hypothetical protein